MIKTLEYLRYCQFFCPLEHMEVMSIEGPDAQSFLNAQLSSNVSSLDQGEGKLSCRLNRTGKLLAWGFVLKKQFDHFYIVTPKKMSFDFKEDLEKFIIMEDVEVFNQELQCVWAASDLKLKNSESFQGTFFNEKSFFNICNKDDTLSSIDKNFLKIRKDDFTKHLLMNGYESLDLAPLEVMVTQTCLLDYGVDLNKGCFLGQEAVAKIVNRKGAPYFPCLLRVIKGKDELNCFEKDSPVIIDNEKKGNINGTFEYGDECYLSVDLYRDYRVVGRNLNIQSHSAKDFEVEVSYFPFFKASNEKHKAKELYELGVTLFHRNDEEMAKKFLYRSLIFDPEYADAYEALGVIYGNKHEYSRAIELMDKLLDVDPDSIMAHTNKSLYFMKMGEIDKAEEEKSLATIATFKSYGKKAKTEKSDKEQEEIQKQKELMERENMFKQVLEIDHEDVIANFGLADIAFSRKEYSRAIEYLTTLLSCDSDYSNAYLLMGKCYESLGETKKAKDSYQKGVDVATRRGDFMPANDMQARLSSL